MSKTLKNTVQTLLKEAGVTINGPRLYDIQVHNPRLYRRVLAKGSLGLGESYMDGWFDVPKLDQFFHRLLRARLDEKARSNGRLLLALIGSRIFNYGRKAKAFEIGEHHYDLGNDLYQAMLDKRLTYTCGYWDKAKNLDQAQEHKLDLVCRKIGLKRGMTVLDIGCGWGSFAKFAAEKYGAKVTGITVSKEQLALGRQLCHRLPVALKLQDYRDVKGKFDRLVSLGMIEHVGHKNYGTYMQTARRALKDDGLFLLHTIGSDQSSTTGDPWIAKYIFPNSLIPSMTQLSRSFEGNFIVEDWHNFGPDYDKTLMAWFHNFHKHWPKLAAKYGPRFYRMWKYYLLACAGSFRARNVQLWQIVLSPQGVLGGHKSVR